MLAQKVLSMLEKDQTKWAEWTQLKDLYPVSESDAVKGFVDIIKQAKKDQDKVIVAGDYDCDGIMATTIMVRGLRKFGIECGFYIPNRIREGYGLNVDTVRLAHQRGYKIIVTVDNGVKASKALSLAKELGMKVIVTDHHTIEEDVIEQVIRKVIPERLMDENTKYLINPTGRFVIGGPQGDTGLTGRKIVVDTYGGFARHGGGAFSGKDPTKVDRSAAYAARYVAKNLVAAGIAHRCEIQIAYAIGVAHPVSVSVNTFGTGVISDEKILELIDTHFDLRPSSIINGLGLRKPIYKQTAAYGHFGRKDLQVPWEWTDKVTVLRNALAAKTED